MSENRETAVIEAAPPVTMDVTVRAIAPKGNLLGFASVTFNDAVTVTDFKILRGEDGIFIGMPSKPDTGSRTGYTNTARIADGAIRQQLTALVTEKYHAEVENLKARVAAIMNPENSKDSTKDAKPPRIADQVAKAAKEAAQHNAALPDQAKDSRGKNAER